MERADFVHLARLSEHASAENAVAYRRGVMAFAALGYAWVLGCLLLACAGVWWSLSGLLHRRFAMAWLLIASAGLLWTSLRALWFRLPPAQGLRITAADAPALFDAVERVRRKVKGPPIHEVFLDAEFNAGIAQRPRWGLFGGARNTLTVGLPLLMALDRQRFLAVLTHEYGHLRGDHGRFGAWIYRTRLSWARLHENLDQGSGVASVATQAFLRWYFPRFVARTFAMARQDEYEADRIAARLLGKDVAGAALAEIAVKGDWLDQRFWAAHWSRAADSALPLGPYAAMREALCAPLPQDFARASLRQALRRISGVEDTHPVLRDRLEALDAQAALPAWSQRAAIELLGPGAPAWIARFDKQWCGDNATGWKQHHANLQRLKARIQALEAGAARGSADELVELADLRRRLDAQAQVQDLYERALQRVPGHAEAMRGLAQAAADPQRRMACLEALYTQHAAHRWWAARAAVDQLEADPGFDAGALKQWRERRKVSEEAEARAWDELATPPFFASTSAHDLGSFELAELQAQLARCEPVAQAWLLRKTLKEFPWRRCYLLCLELPGMDDEARWDLCRGLERWLPLPGPVLALWAGTSPTAAEIRAHAGAAIHTRAAG